MQDNKAKACIKIIKNLDFSGDSEKVSSNSMINVSNSLLGG